MKGYNPPGKQKKSMCINCGKPGPHYVPPSVGDEGFFLCTSKRVRPTSSTQSVPA